VWHDATRKTGPFYLADAAAFGWGLVCLAEATGDAVYREKAIKVGEAIVKNFLNESANDAPHGFWDHTADPNAVGVFTRRQQPFEDNVQAARFFAHLSKLTGDAVWKQRASQTLGAVATPHKLDNQGRMVGDFLLALDDSGLFPW